MAENTNPKQKVLPVLRIPEPHRISGDVDAMLNPGISERFKSIILVKSSEKDPAKGQPVLTHTPSKDDPKVQVSNWNTGLGHLLRFINPVVNAWFSGSTLSGDGSALHVAKWVETVYKAVPQLKTYDLFLVPNGRAGAAKYRMSVQEMVNQVLARAKVIQSCVDTYGVIQGKERTKKSESAPEITAVL